MQKQKFCLRTKSKRSILFACASVVLGLFVPCVLFPSVSSTTHAEETLDSEVSITTDAPVEFNLAPLENDFKISKNTVTINTGPAIGYQLYLSVDSQDHQTMYLNGNPSNEFNKINPVSGTYDAPAALSTNTWGYAVAGLGNFDASYSTTSPNPSSKFAVAPLDTERQLIRNYNDGSTPASITEIYYGIKSNDDLVAGNYVTEAIYTAIPILPPPTAKAILGDNGNLNFVYDRNTYTAGNTYTDNLGETTITNVYTVPMNSVGCAAYTQMPWYAQRDSVTSSNIDASFSDARPTSTCGWFQELRNATTISNLQNLITSNVAVMSYMFHSTGYNATTWSIGDLSGWDTSNVTWMNDAFQGAGYNATTWNIGDI